MLLLIPKEQPFLYNPKEQPFLYNPRWTRVGRLAASDADFIAGRTLYDVKCVNPATGKISREHLFQLLAYACMNACSSEGHELGGLGLINPRAGFVWAMSLDALCRALLSHFREQVGYMPDGSRG